MNMHLIQTLLTIHIQKVSLSNIKISIVGLTIIEKTIIYKNNFRIYDLIISILMILLLCPLMILVTIFCFLESGQPLFFQKRVGRNLRAFYLIKFRTMPLNTPSVASHLINKNSVTKFGKIIRLLKIDELPQLINVIKGDMSLVGPRPCLFNQKKLIDERKKHNIFIVKPGITGLAQIRGIDMSKPEKLAMLDKLMISKLTQINYFKYLLLTLFGKGIGDKVKDE